LISLSCGRQERKDKGRGGKGSKKGENLVNSQDVRNKKEKKPLGFL
jgi:hypothetical protein